MSRTYCHTHSAYDCPTCADEILSLGIQGDKDRIAALEREIERLRKKLASAEREREQSNARLHEVAVACATAERERDDAHEIIDQYKVMAARYKDCMDERDALRKALQKACIGLAHASEANPLYQKNYEACEKALTALAQGKGE